MTELEEVKCFEKGITDFNRKKFFESHEEWEKIWLICNDQDKKLFLQSMIILAGVGVHLQKNRVPQARRLYDLGLKKLTLINDGSYKTFIKELTLLFYSIFEGFNDRNYHMRLKGFFDFTQKKT